MAVSAGVGFDIDDFGLLMQKAKEADKALEGVVNRMESLSKVRISGDITQYLERLKEVGNLAEGLSRNPLSIDIDITKLKEGKNAIDQIVGSVNNLMSMSFDDPLEFFDTQKLYMTDKPLSEIEKELGKINAQMAEAKKRIADIDAANETIANYPAKIEKLHQQLNAPFKSKHKEGTKAYNEAFQEHSAGLQKEILAVKKQYKDAQKLLEKESMLPDPNAERERLIELQAIWNSYYSNANKPKDVQRRMAEQYESQEYKAEEARIKAIIAEQKKLLDERKKIEAEIARYDKAEGTGKKLSIAEQDAKLDWEIKLEEINKQIEAKERAHQEILKDIEERGAKERLEIIENLEKRAYSKDEALSLANKATSPTGTGAELKEALKALESAKYNDTMIGDTDAIEELNKAIVKVRGELEKLQEVTQKENKLQPSLRNEYSRTVAEIEKLEAQLKKLDETQQEEMSLTGVATDFSTERAAITARLQTLNDEKLRLETEANGLLAEEQKKHEAEKTRIAIEEYKKRVEELKAYEKKYGTISVSDAQDVIADTQDAANVRQAQKAIEDLTEARAKLDRNDADYENTLESLNAEIKRHEDYIQSVTNAEKHRLEIEKRNATKDASGALAYSKQAKSLNDMKKALDYLDKARRRENLQTEVGQRRYRELTAELNRQQSAYNRLAGEVKKSSRGMMDIVGQLGRRLALAFSVSQISGYVKKLMDVRGEFELQQRSLQAILQNKDEADKLWNRTVELAVRSPFRVKELVTYTKQLAAFRIESEKLYDTNKMLADISAGLGVDMQRLILALGQVKASNYLRGTELRQFSEAGVNILGELSEYYSKLENTAVSVSGVFERVSKRMVSFDDVETVLKNMTSAGGIFYQMQEKQSETLRGQMMNLRDSIDLMFDEIGRENDGVLKDSVAIIRSLVENWRAVATAIKGVVALLVAYKGAIGVSVLATKIIPTLWGTVQASIVVMTKGIKKANAAQRLFNATSMQHPYIALASVIIGTVVAIASAIRNANAEQRAFNKTVDEGADSARELSANFKRLADIATDPSQGAQKQKEAMEELQRTYKDLLPSRVLDNKELEKMKGNYDDVTTAIYSKIEAQTREKLLSDTETDWSDKLSKRNNKIIKTLTKMGVSTDAARTIVAEFRREFDEGLIDSPLKAAQALERLTEDYTGLAISLVDTREEYVDGLPTTLTIVNDKVLRLYRTLSDYTAKIQEIRDMILKPFTKGGGTELYDSLINSFNSLSGFQEKWISDFKANWEKENGDKPLPLSIELDKMSKDAYVAELQKLIQQIQNKEIDVVVGGKTRKIQAGEEVIAENAIKVIQAEIDKFGDTTTNTINEARLSISQLNNIDLNEFNETLRQSDESLEQYAERIRGLADGYQKIFDDIEAAGGIKTFTWLQQQSIFGIGKSYEDFAPKAKAIIALADSLTKKTPKTTGGGSKDPEMDRIKERIRLINEMNKEYEKLLDNYYTEEEALAAIREEYSESASTAGLNIANMRFDDDGTVAALEEEKAKYSAEKYANAYEKALDERRVELNIEAKVSSAEDLNKEVEELFEMVELSKELKELGLNQDIAGAFGFQFLDLEGLRANLEDMKDRFTGPKGEEDYQKFLERINALENKAMEERMKTYSKYLLEGMSERVKLKIEEMRKLKEIEEADEFTPEQKERITQGVNAETRKALQKQEWEDFKGSEMYTMMFEDLENYGTQALELLRDKIELLKGSLSDLDAPEVKEIISQLNKIDDVIIARKPGAALQNIRQQLADRGVGTSDEETKALETAESIEKNAQEEIDLIHRVQAARQQNLTLTIEDEAAYASLLDTQYGSVEAEQEILDANKEIVDSAQDEQAKRRKNLNLLNQEKQAQIAKLNKANEYLDVVGRGLQAGKELLETVTGETDGVGSAIADAGIGMLSLIQSAITMQAQFIATGIAANSALGIIGWIAIALEAVVMLLSAIFSAKDKALEKQMEEHLATVERLQEAYDKLETAIDEAYSTKQLERYARETQKLTAELIREQEAAIAANKARKQTDEVREQTAEMEKELAALKEQEKETLEDLFSSATDGILDSVADAARDFVDAWYDAFKETGDGLKGLEENFKEMFLNLAKQQAAQQIVGAYADMWKKDLNKYINADSGDLTLTKDEAKKWAEEVRATFPQLSEALEGFLGTITEGLNTTEGGSLTALSKSIQGVSEQTAQVIESLLSSIRLYVAGTNEYARDTATYTKKLFTLFDSLTASGHPSGGRGIRVII